LGVFFGDVWGVSLCDLSFRRDDKIGDVVWGVSLCDCFTSSLSLLSSFVRMTRLRDVVWGVSLGMFGDVWGVSLCDLSFRNEKIEGYGLGSFFGELLWGASLGMFWSFFM